MKQPTDNLGNSFIGTVVSPEHFWIEGAIVKANKTGLTCLYLTLRSVKAVVARDTILMLVCSKLFE